MKNIIHRWSSLSTGLVLMALLALNTPLHAQVTQRLNVVQKGKMVGTAPVPGPVDANPGVVPLYSKAGKNVGPNTLVNDPQLGRYGRSETIIASDASGQFLVAGWNDAQGFCAAPFNLPCTAGPEPGLSGYAWSGNGGSSWTDGGTPPNHYVGQAQWLTRGDPWFDNGGPGGKTFYYSNMAIPVVDNSNYGLTGLLVHRGKFTGQNFSFNQSTLIPPTDPDGADTYDKECIAAGKTGPTKNMVSVAVTNFIEVLGEPQYGYGQIEAYSSGDQAGTFPTFAVVQADETDLNTGAGTVNQGSSIAIGGNGKIFVAWERGWFAPYTGTDVWPQIVFARSDDGGATFGARKLVSEISSAAFFPPPGYNRDQTNDFPRLAVSTGEDDIYYGRVYVTYQDSRIANGGPQSLVNNAGNGNTDVYLRYSSDNGDTWSPPTLIASGAAIQFWPAVSVQPDGTVDVVWYESYENQVDVFYAASTDGGVSFTAPVKVTSASTNWGGVVANIRPNFGDYIGITSRQNRAFACWGDGRPDNHPNVMMAAIAFGTPKDRDASSITPSLVTLDQNYPNPFNPSTSISYSIPSEMHATIKVYNSMGKEMTTLVDGVQTAGAHRVQFDASRLSGGVYLYKLVAGDETVTKTMVLVK